MLRKITQIINAICQPNPQHLSPSSENSKRLLQRNKISLIVYLGLLSFPVLVLTFTTTPLYLKMIRIGVPFSMLTIFIFTCRSYLVFGQIVNATLAHLTILYLSNKTETVYFQLNVAYVFPIFLFLVTNNPYFSAFSLIFQTILLKIKFRQNLLYSIIFTEPEFFVDKFINSFVVFFVVMQAIYLAIFILLNKRTLELSKATKAAKDALEQQKTFVYSFSHEMRNPMNSLLGNLDLALMNNLATETRNMLSTAKTCGILLLNHINTILDVGKMELAKLEVKPAPTKVHDVFQKIWAISCDLIAQKGLKYDLKIIKKVPPLLMLDSHRLGQILLNLIGNATKFTQKGSIGVTVQWVKSPVLNDKCFEPRPYNEEDEGIFEKEENMSFYRMKSSNKLSSDYVVLSKDQKEFDLQHIQSTEEESPGILKIIIRDTGCGISATEIHKLFNKFSQVGNDAYQKSMGTGLGLYISQEICKNMNGEIRVYSKQKAGTIFIICIPTIALPTAQQPNAINDFDRVIEALKLKKLNIIIADDSPFNVNLVSNFCSKFGAQMIAPTYDGLSAYEKYVQLVNLGRTVDVVTLDIDMPVMGGQEACEKIRLYEKENKLKPSVILLISGNYEVQQVSNLIGDRRDRKADSFMRKPLLLSEFCSHVYKHVYNIEV